MSIELRNVSFTYLKTIKALENINLKIEDGEFVGIIGKTGSGKSTLLDILASLVKPTSGQLNYVGLKRDDIGVIFQFVEKQLFESTVEKDVGFILKNKGVKDEGQIREILEYLGFNYSDIKDKSPLEFSIGEKRKIAIAGVLVGKPKVLILDEAFAGLDKDGKDSLIKILQKLNKEGTTIIMISHSSDVICEYAKRVIILKDGSIYKDGKPEVVFKDYNRLLSDGIDVSYVRRISEKLNLSCIKYADLIDEVEKRYHHEQFTDWFLFQG